MEKQDAPEMAMMGSINSLPSPRQRSNLKTRFDGGGLRVCSSIMGIHGCHRDPLIGGDLHGMVLIEASIQFYKKLII
jgi:hypothetical protein